MRDGLPVDEHAGAMPQGHGQLLVGMLLEKGREKLLEFGALPDSSWARHPHALMP